MKSFICSLSRLRSNSVALIVFTLLIFLFGVSVNSEALAQSPAINVGLGSGLPGATVTVPVLFTPGSTAVSTIQFDLLFPATLFYGATSSGPAAIAASKSASANPIAGGLRVLVFGLNTNSIGSGVIASVQFNISAVAPLGSVPIAISGIVASAPDATGVSTAGNGGAVQVLAPVDTTPPVISSITSSSITVSGATITWTTDENSDTQIEYGPTTGYGISTTLDSSPVTSHSQSLSGLDANTTYNYRVKSKDAAGNLATSGNFTFKTAAPGDTTAPLISAVAASGVTTSAATVTWTTDEASDTQIEYGTTTGYGSSTTVSAALVTAHSQNLSGLAANTTYNYRVKSKDAAGNLATSGNFTFKTAVPADTIAPVISAVAASGVTASAATVTWTTDEASDTQIEYGTTTGYGSSTTVIAALVTAHSQNLSGLAANTTYNYRVKSKDAAGNLATSGNFTFKTAAPADKTAPVISAVAGSSITTSAATITWTTDEGSDTQVEYGMTAKYGSSTTINPALITSHSQTLSGLTANTTYHYRVKSRDAAQNLATSADFTFVTKADTASGAVAAYAFDEDTGSQSADLSGNGNLASIHYPSWVSGKYGSALSFDGNRSYVSAGAYLFPSLNQPKTVSFWMYIPARTRKVSTILSLANPGAGAALKISCRDTQIGILGAGDTWLVVASRPSIRKWHHISYVFDGMQHLLYINGVLAASSSATSPAAPVTNFEIGRAVGGSQYFNGRIDNLRIFGRALTSDELIAGMNAALGNGGPLLGASDLTEADAPLSPEEMDPSLQPAAPASGLSVNLDLDRSDYRRGDMLSADSFWIRNLSKETRTVEVKTWMVIPGMQPVPVDILGDEILTLAPDASRSFGPSPVMKISNEASFGTGAVNVRLTDPVSGQVLSEDLNPFTVTAQPSRWRTAAVKNVQQLNPVISLKADGSVNSGYAVANQGADAAAIEIKIWLESADGNLLQMLSAGADSSLVLDAGRSITLYPLASAQLPAGTYTIKFHIIDAASGEVLQQAERAVVIP